MTGTAVRNLAAAGVLVALTTLTGCTGGSGGSGDSLAGSAASSGEVAPSAPDGQVQASTANRTVVRTKAEIKTAEIALTATDLAEVRDRVDGLLVSFGGQVDKEESSNDRDGELERSTLVVRVPVDRFEQAQRAFQRLGKVRSSDEASKDVTTQVIDVDERVQTLQNSLDRLQRFQRAATNVDDLLRYENQITARQSELLSLEAQQAFLADQTSLATITLYLSTPEEFVPPPDALANAGFVTGLEAGWHAFGDVVLVVLTGIGAVIPFAVAAVVLGVPAWLVARTLLRRRNQSLAPSVVDK